MKSLTGVNRWLSILILATTGTIALGQTNPTPQGLPLSQDFGTSGNTTPPPGFATWGGINGASVDTLAEAEASNATTNATPINGTPSSGGSGGFYSYAPAANGRLAILTSSNTNFGACQLAMAIDTVGQTDITLNWDYINVVSNNRGIGSICQYRVGTAGAWTSIIGAGNPYYQAGLGMAGQVTPTSLTLPIAAENQSVVQIRWAVWRDTNTSGNSSGFAIDNINVTAASSTLPAITDVAMSDGPNYTAGDFPSLTVTLASAPDSSATVSVSSGAFATTQVVITAPAVSASIDVELTNAGTFTANATPVSGCSGSAASASFNVAPSTLPVFASAGNNVINDAAGNNNAAIDPSENNIQLTLPIVNTGAAATGISGTLTSLTSGVNVNTGTRAYPNLASSAAGSNTSPFVISTTSGISCGASIALQLAVTAIEGGNAFTINFTVCPPITDPYDPPSDYYTSATGTGTTLKNQLHNIIDVDYWNEASTNHRQRSYDNARFALQLLDRDPGNANNVLLIYTGASTNGTWNSGLNWNREHQWPVNQGVGTSGPAYSDLHNLRACNPSINSSRGESSFGTGSGYWDPDHGQPCRGRVARSMFYMSTRYNGNNPSNVNLVLVNGLPSNNNSLGDLAKLLEWHYTYPPDAEERRRNAEVFSNTLNASYYQGNRNPYIDRPEFAWTIFAGTSNDAKLYLGGLPPADGASTNNVNLGTLIVGAAQPGTQMLTLNKSGANPTTYDVTLSGLAVSNAAGTRQAFVGGAQSRNFTAGLDTTTTIAGPRAGLIVFDNTDLTSSTNGTGSTDGNDVVSISETVLDHANASFTTPTDQNALTINFGDVTLGGSPVTQNFTIHNLVATAGYTAALNLNSISGSGDTARLTTNFTPQINMAAGANQGFTATISPTVLGDFSATYTIANADQSLPGAASGVNLVLTLQGRVVNAACNPMDVNCNGVVNAADLTALVPLLLGTASPCSSCAGDINADGQRDGRDVQAIISQLLP